MRVVVPLQPDADLLLATCASVAFARRCYLMISVTTPAPTVRPPSRMAKRRPSSMAIGLDQLDRHRACCRRA